MKSPSCCSTATLFILEENSTAEIIVCDHTLSPQPFLSNAVTEIYAGHGARLNYTKMQTSIMPLP